MKIPRIPFTTTNWDQVPVTEHAGETGMARWRTQTFGDIRVRMVDYSAGYTADHWCSKGHVILCLEGSMETKLKDGRSFTISAGESYQVGDIADNVIDNDSGAPHRTSTQTGAKLFIVD